jgi:hypothetical protein
VLIKEWKRSYRWLSMHCSAAGAAGSAYWLTLTDTEKANLLGLLPFAVNPGAIVVLTFAATMVVRLINQSDNNESKRGR